MKYMIIKIFLFLISIELTLIAAGDSGNQENGKWVETKKYNLISNVYSRKTKEFVADPIVNQETTNNLEEQVKSAPLNTKRTQKQEVSLEDLEVTQEQTVNNSNYKSAPLNTKRAQVKEISLEDLEVTQEQTVNNSNYKSSALNTHRIYNKQEEEKKIDWNKINNIYSIENNVVKQPTNTIKEIITQQPNQRKKQGYYLNSKSSYSSNVAKTTPKKSQQTKQMQVVFLPLNNLKLISKKDFDYFLNKFPKIKLDKEKYKDMTILFETQDNFKNRCFEKKDEYPNIKNMGEFCYCISKSVYSVFDEKQRSNFTLGQLKTEILSNDVQNNVVFFDKEYTNVVQSNYIQFAMKYGEIEKSCQN